MTCTKLGCARADDDLEKSTIGGIAVIACREHQAELRQQEHVAALFRDQQRKARQLAILVDALKGPAADTQACMYKLDQLMDAEERLQSAVEAWLNTVGAGAPC